MSLMLRGLVRVVRGRNLENLELLVVVVVVASVVWRVRMGSLNLVLTLDLEGEVVCSNLEDSRERDRLLLGD